MTREKRTKLIRHLEYNRSVGADYLITDEDADEIIKVLEQEPCEDAISRDDVITIIAKKYMFKDKSDFDKCVHLIAKQVKSLPPVYPKAKVGKWITWSEEIKCDGYTEYRTRCKCSECDKEHDSYFTHFIKYCSNCGAKMESEEQNANT